LERLAIVVLYDAGFIQNHGSKHGRAKSMQSVVVSDNYRGACVVVDLGCIPAMLDRYTRFCGFRFRLRGYSQWGKYEHGAVCVSAHGFGPCNLHPRLA
jgi:hypothetical protein